MQTLISRKEKVPLLAHFDKIFYIKLFSNLSPYVFSVRFWDGEEINFGDGESRFRIIINEPISKTEVITNPTITLGEAYMNKKLDIEGSIRELVEDFYRSRKNFLKYKDKYVKLLAPAKNTLKKSKENASFHYDIGNDFYRLWLDKSMTYSCAYFKYGNDSLEEAQANKVDYILKKLNLKEGQTLLDIGCGWGELVINAARKYKVKALGITLSSEQLKAAGERIAAEGLVGLAEVQLKDYRQLKDMKFDRIVSVGMLEHVGREFLPEYFQTVNSLLKEGGMSLLHTITSLKGGNDPWLDKYIFPGGYVPSTGEIVDNISKQSLCLLDLESLRRHYGRTLEHWAENFEKSLPSIKLIKDETFVRMWRLYLNSCAASFNAGNIDVHQYVFSKGIADDLPWTRSYLYE